MTVSADDEGELGGSSEAAYVAQQHQVTAVAVEDVRPRSGALPAVPGPQAAAHGMPDVRDVQPPSGDHAQLMR